MWMNDPLKTLPPEIYEATPNVIFSRESGDGPTPSEKRDGQITDPFGLEVVPASLSAMQARKLGLLTSGTFGQAGSGSLNSQNLTLSLANRLKQQLDNTGSTLFRRTWKESATPSGRLFSRLVASVLRISDKEFTSWQTPESRNQEGYQIAGGKKWLRLGAEAKLAGWPTPMAGSPATETYNEAENEAKRKGWNNDLCTAALATRPTPKEQNSRGPSPKRDGLWDVANLATWATPTSKDHKDSSSDGTVPVNGLLGRQVWLTDSGEAQIGSGAETKSIGQLNPAHSRWLMGLPTVWDDCGVMVTRLSRRKRKPSSEPI